MVPNDFEVDDFSCQDNKLKISAKVVNQGCLGVGAGLDVAFYADGNLLGVTQTNAPIPAGGAVTVSIEVDPPKSLPADFHVSVDDDGSGQGALNECREGNNASPPVKHCQPVG